MTRVSWQAAECAAALRRADGEEADAAPKRRNPVAPDLHGSPPQRRMPDSVSRLAASFQDLPLASTLLALAATDAVLLFSRRVQQARGVVDVFHSLHADVWPIEINVAARLCADD